MNRELMRDEMKAGLVWAGGMLALTLTALLALRLGWTDKDTFMRVVIGANGLMMVWYGNRMPKAFVASEHARQARRFVGWSMVLSGLVYVGLWAFAPMPLATVGGSAAVLGGIVATLGYCVSLDRRRVKAG